LLPVNAVARTSWAFVDIIIIIIIITTTTTIIIIIIILPHQFHRLVNDYATGFTTVTTLVNSNYYYRLRHTQ
jgi:hypothetical protein